MEWSSAGIFLAEMCQTLGPFLEWAQADGTTIIRWRDAAMEELARKRYLPNADMDKKSRLVLLDYFMVCCIAPLNAPFKIVLVSISFSIPGESG